MGNTITYHEAKAKYQNKIDRNGINENIKQSIKDKLKSLKDKKTVKK